MTTAVLNETATARVKLRADLEITHRKTAEGVVLSTLRQPWFSFELPTSLAYLRRKQSTE